MHDDFILFCRVCCQLSSCIKQLHGFTVGTSLQLLHPSGNELLNVTALKLFKNLVALSLSLSQLGSALPPDLLAKPNLVLVEVQPGLQSPEQKLRIQRMASGPVSMFP